MNKKNTTLIIYPPGGYGTFVEWCLHYFTEQIPVDLLPFQKDGSSHTFRSRGHPIGIPGFESTQEYYAGDKNYVIARTHATEDPVSLIPNYTVQQYIDRLTAYTHKFVIMNTGSNSRLLVLNNMLTKTDSDLQSRIIDDFREQFGAGKVVPIWQLREMYSYWFDRNTQFAVNAYAPVNYPSVVNVLIRSLADNFQPTIKSMFEQLGLTMHRQDQLELIEKNWRSLQRYLNIDALCKEIIDSTVENRLFNWSAYNLALHDEGYIQWQLRDLHKLDLLCYNLDVFPTNSADLRKLLINANSI